MPRIEERRESVVFDCPHCHTPNVRGTAYNLRETIRLSERVPMWGWSSHWVRCSQCHTELSADCDPQDFRGASPAKVSESVHFYLPFPKRVLAIASLAIGWAPVVGMLLAIISMAANARSKGWPRVVSVVAITLTSLYNAALLGALIYWSVLASRPLPLS